MAKNNNPSLFSEEAKKQLQEINQELSQEFNKLNPEEQTQKTQEAIREMENRLWQYTQEGKEFWEAVNNNSKS